jgi:hypothetical protein
VLPRQLGDRAGLAATVAGAGTNDGGHDGYLTLDGMVRFDSRNSRSALIADIESLTAVQFAFRREKTRSSASTS